MSVILGSSFSDKDPIQGRPSSFKKSVSIENQNSLKYLTVADLAYQHTVDQISSISQERFASGGFEEKPSARRPSGPPDWYLKQNSAQESSTPPVFVSNFVEENDSEPVSHASTLHAGELLGLKEESLALYEQLVKESSIEEKKRLLGELKKMEPSLQFKVSISKSGIERIYVWLRVSPLGEGAFKSCYRAIKMGGKAPEGIKPSAILEAQGSQSSLSFKKDAEVSIAMSELIQQLALGSDVGKIFIKYKKLESQDDEAIKSALANEGDFESKKVLVRCREDAKFRESAMKRLLAAGEFMEKNGISHNDLKLANLLLKDGKLMIADYGLMSRNGAAQQFTIGTSGYIPPDIGSFINSSHVTDSKHDEFSVGVIFLEMMIGESNVFQMGRPSGKFLGGFYQTVNQLEILCEQLAKITPQTAAVDVLIGMLQPYAINRMSFQEAIEKMQGHWGEEQAIIPQIEQALKIALKSR